MNSNLGGQASLFRNERLVHTGMALLMVLCIVGSYFLRCAIAHHADRFASEIDACKSLSELKGELTESIAQAQLCKEQLEQKYHATLVRIPKKLDDSEVLSSVRSTAQASRCNLIDFRPIATQKQDEFQTRCFDLRLEGGFKSLFQFFESLRLVPYIYQVSRFKISEPTILGGTCRVDLELKVVFDHAWTNRE